MEQFTEENGYTPKEIEVMGWIYGLSFSQGFWGRLFLDLCDDREAVRYLGEQDFADELDMIMFIEEG